MPDLSAAHPLQVGDTRAACDCYLAGGLGTDVPGLCASAPPTHVGFRYDANDGFFLNHEHFKIRGFCDHNNFAVVGMAVPDRVNLFRAGSFSPSFFLLSLFSVASLASVAVEVYCSVFASRGLGMGRERSCGGVPGSGSAQARCQH